MKEGLNLIISLVQYEKDILKHDVYHKIDEIAISAQFDKPFQIHYLFGVRSQLSTF